MKTYIIFRKIVAVCILLPALFQFGFTQNQPDSTYTDFGVSVGLNNFQIQEKVLNNIRHSGFFPFLGFSYQWFTEQIKQRVVLDFIVNMVKSRYEAETAPVIIDIALNYTQIRKVSEYNPDLHLFLGGSGGLYSHMAFFDNWDDSHIYWLTYYYLGFNALLTYKNPLESCAYIELGIPLISLVSRPPDRFLYKMLDDSFSWIISEIHRDLRLTTVHQHFVLNIDLGYKFKHSASFQQQVYWRISYTNTQLSYSKEVSLLTHIWGTTLLF